MGVLLWAAVLLGQQHSPCLHMSHQIFKYRCPEPVNNIVIDLNISFSTLASKLVDQLFAI